MVQMPTMDRKVADIMCNYALGVYEKAMPSSLTWIEKLLAARKAGFDFLEMSIDESDEKLARLDMTHGDISDILAAMRCSEIPIRSICLSGHRKYPLGCPDKKKQTRSLEIMSKAIRLAGALGVRVIQIAGYDVYYEKSTDQTKSDFIKNLKLCAEMAAKEGVLLGFETMETDFMDNVEKAMHYVHQIDSPYLGVYPDSGNITNSALLYNTDINKDLLMGQGHLVAMHLKESLPEKYREIPFGTGHVDFNNIITTAWNLGIRRYVTEFWYKNNDNWQETLQYNNDFIRNCFQQLHLAAAV